MPHVIGKTIDASVPRLPWQSAPSALRLAPADVHVWRLHIDEVDSEERRLESLLSSDERARAERFAFADIRRSFVVTRGVLRWLLARYVDEDPRRLRFRYGPHGKPALEVRPGDQAPQFSLSHSHGLALFAITRGREVGIDVERIRDNVACDDLAERFFAPPETAALRRLPEASRRRAFFAYWARKEAIVKANGDGLAGSGSSVVLSPNRCWRVEDVYPVDSYAAAVAASGDQWQITFYERPLPP